MKTVAFLTQIDLYFEDIRQSVSELPLHNGASLQFLCVVETTKIPLYLIVGSPCSIRTEDTALQSWLYSIVWQHNSVSNPNYEAWWRTARPDSPLGILVSVGSAGIDRYNVNTSTPPITELLLYATRVPSLHEQDNQLHQIGRDEVAVDTASISLQALAISSKLRHATPTAEPTPPISPNAHEPADDAAFLPIPMNANEEHIYEPPVRKRKDVFDEATERKKKARRKGGEGVSGAAAPSKPGTSMPSLHRRSISHGQTISIQARTLSRSPSVASSRPPTAVAAGPQRSSLSRVESLAGTSEPGVEGKNKDIISRTVMAGMRLYGLIQKKNRKSLSSGQASPAVDTSFESLEDRREDEEYKLIYHQAYRGTCIAFRSSIAIQDLQPWSEAVRDVVDKLLMVFCDDPMAGGLAGRVDKLTPGGRKAFGSGWANGVS